MKIWKKVKQYPRLGLVLLAFVALGLPDGLLGVGWPSIRAGFSVPLDAIGMFLTAAVAGYMTSSFISGFLLSRVGDHCATNTIGMQITATVSASSKPAI